jgi:uncharacterized protein YecT (DUF1311 family)
MRVPSLVVALAASAFLFSQQASAQTKATPAKGKIIPAEWVPALAPSIKSALGDLKDANSQAQMNLLSRQVADMTDAQLFIAYVRLYERLPQKERDALLLEQAKWLKSRSKATADGVESEGGSLAPLEANNAELTFTEKRLSELRARLKSLESKKPSARSADED